MTGLVHRNVSPVSRVLLSSGCKPVPIFVDVWGGYKCMLIKLKSYVQMDIIRVKSKNKIIKYSFPTRIASIIMGEQSCKWGE